MMIDGDDDGDDDKDDDDDDDGEDDDDDDDDDDAITTVKKYLERSNKVHQADSRVFFLHKKKVWTWKSCW